MDPAFAPTPQWMKDAFLEIRRRRHETNQQHEPLRLLLRSDRFVEFKRLADETLKNASSSDTPPPLQMGGVPVIEGPVNMREPGWRIESDTDSPGRR